MIAKADTIMTERPIRTALLSTDRGFRELVKDVFLAQDGWTAPSMEITVPFSAYGDDQIRPLRQLHPELIILDVSDDPEVGIHLAQYLSESSPGQRFIAAGPNLAPELLLSAMRAGVADYLPKPVTPEALRTAVERLRLTMGGGTSKDGQKQPGLLYTFYSPKGGAGTTTVATNFAVVLQRLTGKKTLLVDLDLELGEIALLLGVQPRFNFVDMVKNFH
ncbi:MAG: response regulator, partial [Pseudonocardiales bacterium]|nr:response regulator [Pseudonocardiales bacterium]